MSERRIIKNQIRRERQLRQLKLYFAIVTATFILVIVLAMTMGSFFSNARPSEVENYKYYCSIMVEYGQTLESIAGLYCDESIISSEAHVEEVIRMNRLSDGMIHAGEYIVVPYYSKELKE